MTLVVTVVLFACVASTIVLRHRRRAHSSMPSIAIQGSANLVLRALEPEDYHKAYMRLLADLTVVGNVSRRSFAKQLRSIRRSCNYVILVVEDTDAKMTIATATLLIESKFIHQCGAVGHIEDVVVAKAYRGRKLGRILVDKLVEIARSRGCYKTILDCSARNAPFYEKCEFKEAGVQMACYHE